MRRGRMVPPTPRHGPPQARGATPAPFRSWTPAANPGAYQTWAVKPYLRQATCEEVNCDHWREGWFSAIDESTPLGRDQAALIRTQSGRRFTVTRDEAGRTLFHFPAGQTCFGVSRHKVQADRPELYVVRGGDWRAAVGQTRTYDRGDQWVDDLHTHTDRLFTARSRAGTAG